ncbi:MAG: hypothetical protein JOZ18_13765, partial [Chloroflexi bacterium]|nr:hypothetical protein [Chloroflexota bacterium]
MNKREDQFAPEFIDEQINQLARVPDQQASARLVHDLRTLCMEDIEIRDRVRARLTGHIGSHTAVSQPNMADEALTRKQIFSQEGRRPVQHLTTPAPGISRLAQLASVLVVALLLASMLWLFTSIRHSNDGSMGKLHSAAITNPQCFTNVPYPEIDLGWQSICLKHEEQIINQSKPLGQRTLTLEAVYADTNRVIVRYSISPFDWKSFDAAYAPPMGHLTAQ